MCLSAVAAFYSIAGLAAIFASAVIPIVIMGSILEAAKIVTTLWLHEYWRQAKISLKIYLVPAVAVLMILTSMGIFGFLSKAHLDQAVPAGDVVAQVSLFDEKIKNERETIANARTLLSQLDKAVNDISSGPDKDLGNGRTQTAAERALQVRQQQARDRAALTRTIETAQAKIVKLQEERAPIASEARKVEAEVGPIKYVAALIYGDQTDTNMLEKAVRWVIIMIVVVFDPLAIMMLLAATESLKWSRPKKKDEPDDNPVPPSVPPTTPDDVDSARHDPGDSMDQQPSPAMVEQHSIPRDQWGGQDLNERIKTPRVEYKIVDDIDEEDPIVDYMPAPVASVPTAQDTKVEDTVDDESDESDAVKQAKARWKADNPDKTLKEQRRLYAMKKIDHLPWMDYVDDHNDDVYFGTAFPSSPHRGQVFVLTDQQPTQVFKFNGDKWILIDKSLSDRYAYNTAYIDHLIEKISKGEYDPDLLSEAESAQIEQRLNQDRT